MKTLDMRFMRYLNLFEKICRLSTKNCFVYNNFLVFAVSSSKISKAIGENGCNAKKMSKIIGKKIKIVAFPEGDRCIETFIASIVHPIKFNSVEVNGEIVISAGAQNKAALIGRDKRRLKELQEITKSFFGKNVKVV